MSAPGNEHQAQLNQRPLGKWKRQGKVERYGVSLIAIIDLYNPNDTPPGISPATLKDSPL